MTLAKIALKIDESRARLRTKSGKAAADTMGPRRHFVWLAFSEGHTIEAICLGVVA